MSPIDFKRKRRPDFPSSALLCPDPGGSVFLFNWLFSDCGIPGTASHGVTQFCWRRRYSPVTSDPFPETFFRVNKPPSSSSYRRNFARDQGYTRMLVLFSLLWRARVSSIVPPFASAHSNSKPALATPLVTGNVISKKEWGEMKKKDKVGGLFGLFRQSKCGGALTTMSV